MYLQDNSRHNLGPGPTVGPAFGGNPGPGSAALKTCVLTAKSNVFLLWSGCKAMLPTLGLSWTHLRRQMPPRTTKLRILSPTSIQACPSCAMGPQLGSSWAQVGANLPEFGTSYAQVGPKWAPVWHNLRPRTAKFDPSRLLVGPSRPASFLSVLFFGCGRFSSRSDSNKWKRQMLIMKLTYIVFQLLTQGILTKLVNIIAKKYWEIMTY